MFGRESETRYVTASNTSLVPSSVICHYTNIIVPASTDLSHVLLSDRTDRFYRLLKSQEMENVSTNTDSNNASSSSSNNIFSKVEGIGWCNAFALEAFFIAARNLLAIVLFAANKNLREKSLFLVINMACADLMLRAVSLPLYIYFVGADYHFWTASPLYIFFHIVDTFFSQASLISAVLISGERFYAIYWPLKHRTLSMKTYRVVIFMAWTRTTIVSTIFLLLNLLIANTSATYAILAYFLVLLSIVCSCNIGIWRKFQRESITSQQQNRASQNRRLTKTLVVCISYRFAVVAPFNYCELFSLQL